MGTCWLDDLRVRLYSRVLRGEWRGKRGELTPQRCPQVLTTDPAQRDRLFNLFHRLVENSLGLMCVHDLDGNLLFVNAAAATALGFRPEEGTGRNLRRYLAPAVQEEFDVYIERIRSTGVDSGLMRLVGKDGAEQVWLYRNTRYEEPGHPPVVLGQAQDVTDLIRAQRKLRESDRRFRILADAAPVMIWMSDASSRCAFFNNAWLGFRGRTLVRMERPAPIRRS